MGKKICDSCVTLFSGQKQERYVTLVRAKFFDTNAQNRFLCDKFVVILMSVISPKYSCSLRALVVACMLQTPRLVFLERYTHK